MMRLAALMCTMILAAGCATQPPIVVGYDEAHDFSDYDTFAWMGDKPLTIEGSLLLPRSARTAVEDAVRDEPQSKGFVQVADRSEADFGVAIVVGQSDAVVIESSDRSVYGASETTVTGVDRIGRRRDGVVVSRSGRSEYELDPLTSTVSEGTLRIEIYELGSNTLVWNVSGSRDISNRVPDGRYADRAVEQLLQEFPPSDD